MNTTLNKTHSHHSATYIFMNFRQRTFEAANDSGVWVCMCVLLFLLCVCNGMKELGESKNRRLLPSSYSMYALQIFQHAHIKHTTQRIQLKANEKKKFFFLFHLVLLLGLAKLEKMGNSKRSKPLDRCWNALQNGHLSELLLIVYRLGSYIRRSMCVCVWVRARTMRPQSILLE